jgi:hypothetical protein
MALSPDGRILAVIGAHAHNIVLLRDADTLAPLQTLAGRILVHAIAFDDVLEIAKSRVTRSLTDAECRTYLHIPACPT